MIPKHIHMCQTIGFYIVPYWSTVRHAKVCLSFSGHQRSYNSHVWFSPPDPVLSVRWYRFRLSRDETTLMWSWYLEAISDMAKYYHQWRCGVRNISLSRYFLNIQLTDVPSLFFVHWRFYYTMLCMHICAYLCKADSCEFEVNLMKFKSPKHDTSRRNFSARVGKTTVSLKWIIRRTVEMLIFGIEVWPFIWNRLTRIL